MEREVEKPVQKFATAGARKVPPAPWVKISRAVLKGPRKLAEGKVEV